MTDTSVTRRSFNRDSLVALIAAAVASGAAEPAAAHDTAPGGETTIRDVIKQRLPGEPARNLILTEVVYPPGAGSPPHLHAKGVMAFVVSGTIASKIGDAPERTYKAGEAWWEPPGTFHRVSRNASTSEPATLLAIFVAPEDATPTDLYKPI